MDAKKISQLDELVTPDTATDVLPIVHGTDTKRIKLTNLVSTKVDKTSVDNDINLSTDSSSKVPTQHAVKAYVDNKVTGLWNDKGVLDCSANPNYPTGSKGDAYTVSVAGKIGGSSGVVVQVRDVIYCTANNAGGTQASVGSSWNVIQTNIEQATETLAGYAEIATQTETNTGTDDARIVTPLKLHTVLSALPTVSGSTNRLSKFNSSGNLVNSNIQDDGSLILTGTTTDFTDAAGPHAFSIKGADNTNAFAVFSDTIQMGFFLDPNGSEPQIGAQIGAISNHGLGFFTNNGVPHFVIHPNMGASCGNYAATPPAYGFYIEGNIQANANVGIGTASPSTSLEIGVTKSIGDPVFVFSNAQQNNQIVFKDRAGASFLNGLTSGGINLGIGTSGVENNISSPQNTSQNIKIWPTMTINAPNGDIVLNPASGSAVAIGTSSPTASAALDISSTVGALLVPRMSSTQEGALTGTNGMIIYNTTTNKFRGYENGAWVDLV